MIAVRSLILAITLVSCLQARSDEFEDRMNQTRETANTWIKVSNERLNHLSFNLKAENLARFKSHLNLINKKIAAGVRVQIEEDEVCNEVQNLRGIADDIVRAWVDMNDTSKIHFCRSTIKLMLPDSLIQTFLHELFHTVGVSSEWEAAANAYLVALLNGSEPDTISNYHGRLLNENLENLHFLRSVLKTAHSTVSKSTPLVSLPFPIKLNLEVKTLDNLVPSEEHDVIDGTKFVKANERTEYIACAVFINRENTPRLRERIRKSGLFQLTISTPPTDYNRNLLPWEAGLGEIYSTVIKIDESDVDFIACNDDALPTPLTVKRLERAFGNKLQVLVK